MTSKWHPKMSVKNPVDFSKRHQKCVREKPRGFFYGAPLIFAWIFLWSPSPIKNGEWGPQKNPRNNPRRSMEKSTEFFTDTFWTLFGRHFGYLLGAILGRLSAVIFGTRLGTISGPSHTSFLPPPM